MSHHVDSMAYYGTVPWHRLGTQVKGVMTAAEAISAANLDWKVEKRPVWFLTKDGGHAEMEDKYVTVRTDREEGLGVVGSDYTVFQNKEAFSFFDAIVAEKAAIYHTCGSLKGGAVIWILAKLPTSIKVLGKDQVDFYTMLVNWHNGGGSILLQHTPTRVVCWNTLSAAMSGGESKFKIRHSSQVGAKVAAAREALGIVTQTADDILVAAEAMARKKLNAALVEDFLKGIDLQKEKDESARRENQRMEVLRLIETGYGHGQTEIKNSLWTAYNAVTQFVDHANGSRTDEQKLYSSWFEGGARLKQQAFDTALALVK